MTRKPSTQKVQEVPAMMSRRLLSSKATTRSSRSAPSTSKPKFSDTGSSSYYHYYKSLVTRGNNNNNNRTLSPSQIQELAVVWIGLLLILFLVHLYWLNWKPKRKRQEQRLKRRPNAQCSEQL